MTEYEIEQALIEKLKDLKYTYRPEIRNRATLEQNFRKKFEALNQVNLTDGEFARLLDEIITPDVYAAARMLRANRDRPIRVFTGDSRRGRTRWVYGRENSPCLRCGTPIAHGHLGADPTRERNVFWCPSCQR